VKTSWKRFLIDFIMLATLFSLTMLGATIARGAPPCVKWFELVDGKDVQTNEPVHCDGALGPKEQFAELMKCASSELPGCQVKLSAEQERAGKIETALKKKVEIEKKRADDHAAENDLLRAKLEDVATVEWYEHPVFWAVVGAAVVGVVWGVVEALK
jgi:hypothetical protein